MDITTLTVSMFATNCYLVQDRKTGEGIVIDPGDEAERIIGHIHRRKFKPTAIVLTHGHGDHIGAVEDVKAEFAAPVLAGRHSEEVIKSSNTEFSEAFGVQISCPMPDRYLQEKDIIPCGSQSLAVIETPGHSPGGICLYCDGILFCGDTLFENSVGRTDLPGGNHGQLLDSITQKLLVLPDETICYPGHGPVTTIGRERRHNPFLIGGIFG